MPEFSAQVMAHLRHPRNVGPLDGATAVGEAGDPHTSNRLKIWVRVSGGIVEKAAFKAYGCVPAIAAGSAITEMAEGKTIVQARGLTPADVMNFLGGLPPERQFCARLAVDALRNALGRL